MNQYDRIKSGKATQEQVQNEIAMAIVNRPLYKRIPAHVMVEEFLVPQHLELKDVSRIAKITPKHMSAFIRGEARIDDMMASKLSRMFRTTKEYWLDLQTEFDSKGSL